jgi:hypothetical protein
VFDRQRAKLQFKMRGDKLEQQRRLAKTIEEKQKNSIELMGGGQDQEGGKGQGKGSKKDKKKQKKQARLTPLTPQERQDKMQANMVKNMASRQFRKTKKTNELEGIDGFESQAEADKAAEEGQADGINLDLYTYVANWTIISIIRLCNLKRILKLLIAYCVWW